MNNLQDLVLKNPWWDDKAYKISEVSWVKRDLYNKLRENLENPLILSIIGLRRTGKSTLVRQLVGDILKKKIANENLFYYLFDYETQLKTAEFLEEVLRTYFDEIQQKPITALTKRVYIFLDEVQYIDNWQAVLKKYYDLSGKKIKFIITGSQSLLLKDKDKESLAGRIFDFYLPPLSFAEYFQINNIKISPRPKIDLYDLSKGFSKLQRYHFKNGRKLKKESERFIINGQFPEIKEFKTLDNKREYILESVLGKVLADIIRIGKIEKPDKFKLFVFHLLNNTGSLFELENIGRELGLSKITTEKYFSYLQKAYLVKVLYKYHKSVIKEGRTLKKVYTTCSNFTCALNRYNTRHIKETPEVFGSIIENVIYNVLHKKYGEQLFFYRQRQKEIDFIIINKKKFLAIEVKISSDLSQRKFKTLSNYMAKKKLEYGIIVTRNILERKELENGQTLYFIPYYLLLF